MNNCTNYNPSTTFWLTSNKIYRTVIARICVSFLLCITAPNVYSSDILEVTRFTCGEINQLPEKGWVALYQKNGLWFLSRANAYLVRGGNHSEICTLQSDISESMFMLRDVPVNIDGKEKNVASIIKPDPYSYTTNNAITIKYKGVATKVVLSGKGALDYISGEHVQSIRPGYVDGIMVEWAGDLDDDGLLDLILSIEVQGGGYWELYLSSQAKKGELLGRAATRWVDD